MLNWFIGYFSLLLGEKNVMNEFFQHGLEDFVTENEFGTEFVLPHEVGEFLFILLNVLVEGQTEPLGVFDLNLFDGDLHLVFLLRLDGESAHGAAPVLQDPFENGTENNVDEFLLLLTQGMHHEERVILRALELVRLFPRWISGFVTTLALVWLDVINGHRLLKPFYLFHLPQRLSH